MRFPSRLENMSFMNDYLPFLDELIIFFTTHYSFIHNLCSTIYDILCKYKFFFLQYNNLFKLLTFSYDLFYWKKKLQIQPKYTKSDFWAVCICTHCLQIINNALFYLNQILGNLRSCGVPDYSQLSLPNFPNTNFIG